MLFCGSLCRGVSEGKRRRRLLYCFKGKRGRLYIKTNKKVDLDDAENYR
jgi:hypothetical protein